MNFASGAEVDEACATALGAGARAVKQPIATAWGGYSGYFADPDGHYWEVVYGPGIQLDSDGRVLSMGD